MTASTDAEEAATDESEDSAKAPEGRFGAVQAYLPNRREAIFLAGGALVGALGGAGGVTFTTKTHVVADRNDADAPSTKQARELLEEGNHRFVAGTPEHPDQTAARRTIVATGQHPFAAILSCADSRVPPEVLFDQGLGDLFVVRSAGQVVDKAVLGSLQYGAEHLKTPLIVVLGHTACGAVKATIEAVETKAKPSGTAIDDLVTAIKPAVVEAEEVGAEGEEMVEAAIGINVERVVEALKADALLGEFVAKRELKVVGAIYSLTTGEVEWL
ncbi:MAG: carbonic anhydrase [Kineosporiaceae bacterium]|nr:carbonic anhydrase [Kineosporiaceae bacterium]MBK7624811.1 carbonic anhydrase [Kineosporiaceae bacterium]MBK8076812.1 carbonic anhydrase [Kineosporiaceae bacterium]